MAESAWLAATEDGEVSVDDLLERQVRRRLAGRERPLGRKAYARVYNALLRSGFPADAVDRALERHRSTGDAPDASDDALVDGEP